MTTTTTVTYWNPLVVYGPLGVAHAAAVASAAAAGTSLAPGAIRVFAAPTGTYTAALTAVGKGATFQEYGARPHAIQPAKKKVMAGKGFGPVGGSVSHPGNPALHFAQRGAETYPEALLAAGRAAFPG